MFPRVLLLFTLVAGLVGVGCGADAELAEQEAVARARTCANLAERRQNEPVEVPAVDWFSEHAAAEARRTGTEDDRKRSNNREMKDDCKVARAFGIGTTFDDLRKAVTRSAESTGPAGTPGPDATAPCPPVLPDSNMPNDCAASTTG